jgi:hypothetical protein
VSCRPFTRKAIGHNQARGKAIDKRNKATKTTKIQQSKTPQPHYYITSGFFQNPFFLIPSATRNLSSEHRSAKREEGF